MSADPAVFYPEAAGEPPSRLQRLRRPLLVAAPVLLAIAGAWFWFSGGRYVSTDNAYVRGSVVQITGDVPGLVVAVPVADNQQVEAGAVLVQIDPEPYRLKLAGAEAELAAQRSAIEARRAQVRSLQVQLEQTLRDIEYFNREYQRQATLLRTGSAAHKAHDDAQHAMETAQAKAAATRPQIEAALALIGGALDVPVETVPSYRTALAQRDVLAYELQRTTIKAPRAGRLGQVSLRAGEYVSAGRQLFALLAADEWVEANVKETDLTHLRPGQEATIEIDAWPGQRWHASVASLRPGTGSEFSVLPAENATGNWVKIVQRVPVRLQLRPDQALPPLTAGLSVTVSIDTGTYWRLPRMLRGVPGN